MQSQELAGQVAMQKMEAENMYKMKYKQAEIAFEIEKTIRGSVKV